MPIYPLHLSGNDLPYEPNLTILSKETTREVPVAVKPNEIPKPLVVEIDARSPQPTTLEKAAQIIRDGGLVAFPTETVYGLGADALSPKAVHRIFDAKGRPCINPVIVHIANESMLASVTTTWKEKAQLLAQAFWPGPLTLVLPKHPDVPDVVTAGGPTVAVRWPKHPVAQGLINASGRPIAAPSANRSSELSPTLAKHVIASLGDQVDMILDGGMCSGGIESTVVDLSCDTPRLLRPGLISLEQLREILGQVEYGQSPSTSEAVLSSPGLLPRHYSPRTPLRLFDSREELMSEVLNDNHLIARKAAIVMGSHQKPSESGISIYCMPTTPDQFAMHLYATLHEADLHAYQEILMEMPPELPQWLAIRDRLMRAATKDT
jgi:L-threonylcarbamoyladenylate synthase